VREKSRLPVRQRHRMVCQGRPCHVYMYAQDISSSVKLVRRQGDHPADTIDAELRATLVTVTCSLHLRYY
jgi:hypothetical protein